MNKFLIAMICLLLINNFRNLKIVRKKITSSAIPIDENWIEEIVNGVTNGLVPRIHLSKMCEENNLLNTSFASLNGNSITEAIKLDLPNDFVADSFANIWQICEENGAALSPALIQFSQQLRTQKELTAELSGSLAGAKLSAWVLAFLPLFGVVLAGFLGVNSIKWLQTSQYGKLTFISALILEMLGIIWVKRITQRITKLI